MTRGPAKPTSAPGSASIISPSIAKLAVTPPVVGSVSTVIYRSPASSCCLSAAEVFAICISDTIPSCILAPPEQVNIIIGSLSLVAFSAARVIFSPTFSPMLPIRKCESHTHITHSCPLIRHLPVTTASSSPVDFLTELILSGYPSYCSGSDTGMFLSHSSKLPSSAIMAMRSDAFILIWCPHFGHTIILFSSSSVNTEPAHSGHCVKSPSGILGISLPSRSAPSIGI